LTAEDRVLELIGMVGDRVLVLHGPREEEGLSGRDVDCIVDGLDLRWPLRLSDDWRLSQWFWYDLGAWYWQLERQGEYVAIDTSDDPSGFGRDALRTREFMAQANDKASPLLHAAYLTIKRVRKGMFEPAEWARIGKVASAAPLAFAAELERLGGPAVSRLLAPAAIVGVVPARRIVRTARRLLWIRRFGSAERVVRAVSLGARRYANRIVNPAGLTVLLIGPDGAGKSTLAERLPEVCAPMFRRHARSHWRPGILPRPGAVVGRAASDPTRPHARDAYGHLPSIVFLGYYWLDFLVGGIVHDLPMKIRSGLAVRERGWWDLAVDPRRYRLEAAPWAVRVLGGLLPRPDLAIMLEAEPKLLRARKPELDEEELRRQLAAWRSALPKSVPLVRIDVSRPLDMVVSEAVEAVTCLMESRAVSRLDSGWATLPTQTVRWWLPRGPRNVAMSSLGVYQPVTDRARLGWSLARGLAGVGGFRLLPRGSAPPPSVRRALAPHVPPRGTYAVARATHEGRFVALLLDETGRRISVAKIATDAEGAKALDEEAAALHHVADGLPGPLAAPRLLLAAPKLLLLEPVEWVPRRQPWVLEADVARALGEFFRAGSRTDGDERLGPAHGDCAPWNLLQTRGGWALVDWEGFHEAPAFHDVCHYLVQSHALLGRPTASEVVVGFTDGRGLVGAAVRAYAEAAGTSIECARDSLVAYLRRAVRDQTARTDDERKGCVRRRRLLARVEAGEGSR